MIRFFVVVSFSFSLLGQLSAQTTGTTQQTPVTGSTSTSQATPAQPLIPAVPYSEKEFPPWVLKLRRAEILTVGAFPIAYLFAGLGYDYTYYLSAGFPSDSIPWPAGPGTSRWTTTNQPDLLQRKNLTLVGVALGLSLLVATADWLLGL